MITPHTPRESAWPFLRRWLARLMAVIEFLPRLRSLLVGRIDRTRYPIFEPRLRGASSPSLNWGVMRRPEVLVESKAYFESSRAIIELAIALSSLRLDSPDGSLGISWSGMMYFGAM